MKSILVGIVGSSGTRAKSLINLFERPKDNVCVWAMADANKPKFGDYRSLWTMLNESGVDTVVVLTPDIYHEKHACLALNAGKNVYLEKPMAITPEGCQRIIDTAKANNRIVYVGHNLRHFTVIKNMKEIIDQGHVGDVKAIWCRHPVSYGHKAYFEKDRWHRYRENSGSLLIHKASHDLDIIHWFANSTTKKVVAMGTNAMYDATVEDLSSVLLELENGVQATYSQCHFAHLAYREYMIIGTKGTLINTDDNPSRAVVKLFDNKDQGMKGISTQEWRFTEEKGFHGDADKRIIGEFINVIRGNAEPTISPVEAMNAVKAAYAATESLRSGSVPIYV